MGGFVFFLGNGEAEFFFLKVQRGGVLVFGVFWLGTLKLNV